MAPRQPRHYSQAPSPAETTNSATASTQCNILDTTFSLHRVSPLFLGMYDLSHGPSEDTLQNLSERLHDQLVGDSVRGIEIGRGPNGDDASFDHIGALEAVAFEWTSLDFLYGSPQHALQLTLHYENAQCSAHLLPIPSGMESSAAPASDDRFLHLPLLLMRMPAPLQTDVVHFLSTSFDCHIHPLRLQNHDLIHYWEVWAGKTAQPSTRAPSKDAVLTLAFQKPKAAQPAEGSAEEDAEHLGIATIDILISGQDLTNFLAAGQRLARHDKNADADTPCMAALGHYVQRHLGLDIFNPAVSIVRIANEGFVLAESRLKVFTPPQSESPSWNALHQSAVRQLVGGLSVRASSGVS